MARTATKKAAPEPEVDLTEYLEKEPSEVNKAEAAWLVECTGLQVGEEDMELVETVVMLVAGKAHRDWQKSETAAAIHEARADRRAAALEERQARKAERANESDDDENPKPRRRGRPKAASLAEEPEDEAPAPKPRRGRPAKAAAPIVEEEEDAPAPKRAAPRRRAKAGAEAPF